MTTQNQCVVCLRTISGPAAKPSWVFTRQGECLGLGHASHRNRVRQLEGKLMADPYQSVDEGRRTIWLRHIEPLPASRTPYHRRTSPEFYAHLLAYDEGQKMEERLAWWATGPLNFSPEWVDRIRREYAAIQERYQAWLSREAAAV